ncbi:class I SAM-dependent methyltransferase [Nakamurella flavida]|uniref:Class I SAM-dependent methyltransferase n=1 Tax=Nakamurella flavida TaxID=363630 RepID=A0A938YSD5_9ACTN|nr:class I SAM-dependent methyltransferase [Nakamurella flavida]MBM9478343.1 class I SAM-dependent methyltransferase [Nakamurella flavida]MDP9777485.1 SAM-dependent methyltransferase [Nakamurella flavida]
MQDGARAVVVDPVQAALAALVAPGSTVIDVGGGSGTRAVPLARQGCVVTVVDSSIDALAILRRRAAEAGVADRVHAVQADADRLAGVVPQGQADLVVCHHLLEQVDDLPSTLSSLAAALRPGGRLSLLVPGLLSAVLGQALAGRAGEARAMLADPAGRWGPRDPLRRRFDIAGISADLAAAGLEVDQVTGLGVVSGLLSGRSTQASDGDLAALEQELAVHEPLRRIAGDLHVLARKPVPSNPDPAPSP